MQIAYCYANYLMEQGKQAINICFSTRAVSCIQFFRISAQIPAIRISHGKIYLCGFSQKRQRHRWKFLLDMAFPLLYIKCISCDNTQHTYETYTIQKISIVRYEIPSALYCINVALAFQLRIGFLTKGTEPEKQRPKKGCRKGHLCEGRGIGRKKSGTGIKKGEHMIILDYKDARPIYEQVVEKFKLLILKGILEKGEQMPSVRSLAMDLSINPNTIQ